MKKLGKILLVASSVLSVGALALSIDAVNKNKEFTYSVGETNNDGFGIKRVAQGETVEKPTFTTGGASTIISPAVAQAKTNEDNTKSLRFVAAVSMENDAALNEYLTGLNGKEIGFHVAYDKDANKVDLHLRVQYAYRSISAGENTYRANGELQEGEKGIADWITACGSTYTSPEEVTYNYFLVLEIDGIAEDYLANIVTVQPYIKNGAEYTYASHYKKANANERSLFFLDVNGTQTLMENNPANGTDPSSGEIKDEYMLTKVNIEAGSRVTIRDSLGISHNKYEHSVTGEGTDFVTQKTCQYNFYYKSTKNTNKNDETYIQQQLVVHKLVTKGWWRTANAVTGIYLIEKGQEITPSTSNGAGTLMTLSETKIENQDTYEYEIDTFKYTSCYFTRVNPNDKKVCWNHTKITSTQGKDIHYLDNTEWSQNIW